MAGIFKSARGCIESLTAESAKRSDKQERNFSVFGSDSAVDAFIKRFQSQHVRLKCVRFPYF